MFDLFELVVGFYLFNCLVGIILHIWICLCMIYIHIYNIYLIFIQIHEKLCWLNRRMMNTRLVWIFILVNMKATIHFGLPCPYRKLAHPCAHNPPWYPLEELLVVGVAWSNIPSDQVLSWWITLPETNSKFRLWKLAFLPQRKRESIPTIYFQV